MCYPAVILSVLIVAACVVSLGAKSIDESFDDARKDGLPW